MQNDPLKTMFEASRNGGPYDCILEAARQLDAGRPVAGVDDMFQWTSLASKYDAGWLTRQNKRIDAEIREVLKLHPAWPVVKAIEAGLKERAERIKDAEHRAKAIQTIAHPEKDYQQSYAKALDDMAYDLDAHIAQLDRMDLWALIPARRNLATARHEIETLMAECREASEVAA